jgi:hypothetical protein
VESVAVIIFDSLVHTTGWDTSPDQKRTVGYPVLQRYIVYISARILALGGEPGSIPASLSGAPRAVIAAPLVASFTGKVAEVFYDCFGEFVGFALEGCYLKNKLFWSCEKTLGELIMRVCRDRLTVTVVVDKTDPIKICGLRIRG